MSVDQILLDEIDTGASAAGPKPADAGELDARSPKTRLITSSRYLSRRPGVVLAFLYMAVVVLAAVWPSLFTGASPIEVNPTDLLKGPSVHHLFGTDALGRDMFSRVVHGTRLPLEGTGIAVSFAGVVGLLLGTASGFFGGWVDAIIMRFIDVLLSIPALLFALTLVTALGFGEVQVAIAVGFGMTPGFARTTRAEVLRVRTLPYVEAARTGGVGWLRIMFKHVLPNSTGPVAALAVLDIGTAVLVLSTLSFLGFGAPPPATDWGDIVSDGSQSLAIAPYLVLLPSLVVILWVFSANHVGLTIRQHQDK
jgi:peptide/nickel transport system permease protein